MFSPTEQQTIINLAELPDLTRWANGFITSKRAERRAGGTLTFYREKLTAFVEFCAKRNITAIESIDPALLREFLLNLEENGHNPGGVHGYFRAVKAFLRWYENEVDDPAFKNPIRKVKAPSVPEQILAPVELADAQRMADVCGNDKRGLRDHAILLTLLDTGARADELCGFDLADLDPATGELTIRRGKGGKGRKVFIGQRARRAVRAWLKIRGPQPGPLFLNRTKERIGYQGLRRILQTRAAMAGLTETPSPHDFRRACAINLLKNGADLLTVSRLLGHSALQVTTRYLKQTADDLKAEHAEHSPVDRAGI